MVISIDDYIERNAHDQADRKLRELESEYFKSGYWPIDNTCPHQWRDGRCEWCGEKEK